MKSNHDDVAAFRGITCVFLDRDGVINRKPREGSYVSNWADCDILPGVESAIAKLNLNGFYVLVVSNQRGIALGLYTEAAVHALHARLQEQLSKHGAHIDKFYFCPHDEHGCDCRKPQLGMFLKAFRDFPLGSAANCVVVGDSLSDIEAARRLGCRSIFIQGDPQTQKAGFDAAAKLADVVAGSLSEAVNRLLMER